VHPEWRRVLSMRREFQVTFDAHDPPALAAFWREALGYVEEGPPEGYDTWDEFADDHDIPEDERSNIASAVDPESVLPRLLFLKVPEGKTAKNRVHLDVRAGGPPGTSPEDRRRAIDAEADRLSGFGATRVRSVDELTYWVVMQDPEGNEFCVD
jgi:hypothetical protein